ncbi:MAG: hypothetical protein AAGA84_10370 [Pseudomonadota bacterium]
MEEKRRDLKITQRRRLLERMVADLANSNPNLYYMPTIDVATLLEEHIRKGDALSQEEHELLKPLSRRDIQILLSIHDNS